MSFISKLEDSVLVIFVNNYNLQNNEPIMVSHDYKRNCCTKTLLFIAERLSARQIIATMCGGQEGRAFSQ